MNAKLIANPIICKKSINSLSVKYSDEIRSREYETFSVK